MVYWTSNYLFDIALYFVNICTLCLCFKVVLFLSTSHLHADSNNAQQSLNDMSNDFSVIASNNLIVFYFFVYMTLTCGSWATLAYLWSHLGFRSDIIAFVCLFMLMCMASFVDMVMVIVNFFLQIQQMTNQTFNRTHSNQSSSESYWIDIINKWRDVLAFLWPNVAAKRALFNLKIQNLPQCRILLNTLLNSNMSNATHGFDYAEPGIGRFLLLNVAMMALGVACILLVENRVFNVALVCKKITALLRKCGLLFRRRQKGPSMIEPKFVIL